MINIVKNDIIMSIDKKYLDRFIKEGWSLYNGTKEPSQSYEGD